MTNQNKYFKFIISVLSAIFIVGGVFVYIPSIGFLNKPSGQVLGAFDEKSDKKTELDPFSKTGSEIDFTTPNLLELRLDLKSSQQPTSQLLVKIPSIINGKNVERDSEQFYIPCGNNEVNNLKIAFNPNANANNIKNFLTIKQSISAGKCNLSDQDISKIIDNVEIRSSPVSFDIKQVTSIFQTQNIDYFLSGNCTLNGATKDLLARFTQKCSLWSLAKPSGSGNPANSYTSIYPSLINSNLRTWFPAGDIDFFEDGGSTADIPYKLVSVDALKKEANIFYIKNDNLKLVDFKEIKNLSEFINEYTTKAVTISDYDNTKTSLSEFENLFYRKNQLPILTLPKPDLKSDKKPDKKPDNKTTAPNISCAWESKIEDELWNSEILPTLPLTRTNPCNIGAMIVAQNVKGLSLSNEELSQGDAWFLDNSAIKFTETIFEKLKLLGIQEDELKNICQNNKGEGEPKKLFFERQLCPFGISSTDDLNKLNSQLEITGKKVGTWRYQEFSKDADKYQIYTQVTKDGLWTYWFKLADDGKLAEKRAELHNIMQKVSFKE